MMSAVIVIIINNIHVIAFVCPGFLLGFASNFFANNWSVEGASTNH